MSRDDLQMGEPKDPAVLEADFPRASSLDGRWYRAHSDGHLSDPDRGCWWFASYVPPRLGEGRFDLPAPRGTCYFADVIEAAVRERLGPRWGRHPYLPPVAYATGMTVSEVNLNPHVDADDVADTDCVAAAGFVTREISDAPYALTQRHAAAFAKAGFEGILYAPRFTPGKVRAVAVFGEGGRPSPGRAAVEVADWQAELKSPVRSTVARRRARIIP